MDLRAAAAHWSEHGFSLSLLPGFLSPADIGPAQAGLPAVFPTADDFHDDAGPARNLTFRDEFGGILRFPWSAVELCLLAVHPRLIELAEAFLQTSDLRLYSAEAWAKYTGAADYDQELHRDYLNHTPLVPSPDPQFGQLELFVWLSDVTKAHGPTHVVSRRLTKHLPASPNWLGRSDVPDLYDAEVAAVGPAGTVLAYSPTTFHRGTAMTAPTRGSVLIARQLAGPGQWSGPIAMAGRRGRRPSHRDGTSSSCAPRSDSCVSSASLLLVIRTGPM